MGECRLVIDGRIILDIGPTWPDGIAERDEADPGSIINGGPGVPVVKPEGRR